MSSRPASAPELVAEGLSVRFGGLVAVDAVSLRAEPGVITGLIGPNGAGKTTTFNALTGVVACRGSVRLGSRVLDGLTTQARAQAGLGRSFQRMELMDTMSVGENVRMGPELLLAGRGPWRHLFASRREHVDCCERADRAMARCGIGDLAERAAGDVSTGQRRLVELARAIASNFPMLLLDEPSSGLDSAETEVIGDVLLDLAGQGTGVLLVEHDMTLVRAVCERIYVLDFGRLLIDGPAADVLASDRVKAAYLGTEAA